MLSASPCFAGVHWITGNNGSNPTSKAFSISAEPFISDAPISLTSKHSYLTQKIIVCHLTTCTKIVNNYPIDSNNYFYLNKNKRICYFAYFLIQPQTKVHTIDVSWYNPSGMKIAHQVRTIQLEFTNHLLTLENKTYQWMLVTSQINLRSFNSNSNQTGLPETRGLYTIHLRVDGNLVGITFFYIKKLHEKNMTLRARPSMILNKQGKFGNALPMFTPSNHIPKTF